MRLLQLSVVLPVLVLVSANLDHHHQNQRRRHGLVARQRSSSGVLGPLLGEEEESATIATPLAQSTVMTSSDRTSIISTEEDTTVSPTPSPSTSSAITRETSSSSTPSSLSSSIISSIISSDPVASASNSSTMASSSSSNTSSAVESSTSSMPSSAEPSMSLSVDAGGETIVVTVMQSVVTESVAPTQAPAASSAAPEKKEDDDGLAIPMGAIIGISVGAGLVILLLIGLAVWRMKKRSVDDDDAIRWPELNRHGDSDAHHALPAVQTGKHGIETSPLERSTSNSSSIFTHSVAPAYDAAPAMALNGSDFGGTTTLDNDYYEKSQQGHDQHSQAHGYDLDSDYTSYPPVVQPHTAHSGVHGAQDDGSDDEMRAGGRGHPTYGQYR